MGQTHGMSTGTVPPKPARQGELTHPLTVPGVQREPEGDGAALALGHGLHPVWVLRARREAHGAAALRLDLRLPGTGQPVRGTRWDRGGVGGPQPSFTPCSGTGTVPGDGDSRQELGLVSGPRVDPQAAELLTVSVLASSSVK